MKNRDNNADKTQSNQDKTNNQHEVRGTQDGTSNGTRECVRGEELSSGGRQSSNRQHEEPSGSTTDRRGNLLTDVPTLSEIGIHEQFIPTENGDKFLIRGYQDAEPIIENNKELFNSPLDKRSDMWRVASIPLVVWTELEKKGITKDKKKFARWLDDPDNRFFRTSNIRVSKITKSKV